MVEVYSGDIGHSYLQIAKYVIKTIIQRTWDAIKFGLKALQMLGIWIVYSIQAWPVYAFLLFVFILLPMLWDFGIKRLIEFLVDGWNAAIGEWNNFANSLRNMGFDIDVPGLGNIYIPMGIPAPNGDTVSVQLQDFKPMVMGELGPKVITPFRNSLTGIIFANDI